MYDKKLIESLILLKLTIHHFFLQKGINPLVISNADISKNQGTYICTVSNSLEKATQSQASVVIIQSSRIKKAEGEEIEIEPPNSLQLACDAMIDKRIRENVYFQWSLNDLVLPVNKSELSINEVTKDDSG